MAASELRVVVFTNEIKDGTLGGAGRILRLPDIYQLFSGDESREAAEQVLAARRRREDWVVGGLDEAGVPSVLSERAPA